MKTNKKGQIGVAVISILVIGIVLAVAGPVLVEVTEDVASSTTDQQGVQNESETLLNASGESCTGCWTTNLTNCYKLKWVEDSVIIWNTTPTCASGCLANVSYIDCALNLNGTLQNGTYNISYSYYPDGYINSTGYRSAANQFDVLFAVFVLIVLAFVAFLILGSR